MATSTKSTATKSSDPAPKETTLDQVDGSPATTVAGDAPFDTTDPSEHGSTITAPVPDEAALKAGTVNAIQPTGKRPAGNPLPPKSEQRIEKYKATKPDGTEVTVEHNLDTGETKLV
jgi:hypothetical protein